MKQEIINDYNKKLVEDYILEKDWRTKENSNAPKSFGALNKHLAGEVSKNYWLNNVYTKEIREAYIRGEQHIHDLGGLTLYCCGFSLESILLMGVQGISNIPTSSPAKHFSSVLNQIANLTTVYQNEIMGAVAFNNVDTLLAPFIAHDGLTREQVKQELQNFIYSINSNSRGGAEPAFTNVTLDVTPSVEMLTKPVIVGGRYHDEAVYGDFQKEIDMFNDVFCDLMLEGDSLGQPFSYPIPTYNIGKRFNWDNPLVDKIFEMAGKFGYPYFANFINSDMKEDDIRSMCCRFQIDLRELKKRNGGLFGSGDNTGSIGVVTINLPRIGFLAKDKQQLFEMLDKQLVLAKESLELKRQFLDNVILKQGLLPAYMRYVGTLDNHFSTIGEIGKNEMCENFLGKNILTDEGRELALEVGEYIRTRLADFQEETGHLYNYEGTPAEGTCYSLAKKDKEQFPNIITRGTKEAPYYTNSCHMPVGSVESIKQLCDHQDDLQVQYTGGTVNHLYMDGAISGQQAKHIMQTVLTNYRRPYTSISPINRYCSEHGYVADKVDNCPKCGKKLELFQRITGYLRRVENFNIGKKQEFKERSQIDGEQDSI